MSHAPRYVHALSSVPVHVGTLTGWLRTRARWLRLDVMRAVDGTSSVYLRVGGPYATPEQAAEAARHARDFSGIPIGLTPPVGPDDDDEGDDPCLMTCPPT